MKQSIMGRALLKGSIMALTNACIIWLFAYIAGFDRSVWMVVIIIAAERGSRRRRKHLLVCC